MSQTEKTLSWILKGGLLATPFLVFIVTRPLYFPFITGKNFAFRILIELLAVVWVYAALRFPSFRPRSSAIGWSVAAFIAVMGIATAFALSPYKSFWSDFERMDGYVGLLHLSLYFLLLVSIFTTNRDWRIFFHTSLGASVIVSLYAVLQLAGKLDIHQGGTRVDATLGNATYLAAYLLFHLFFLIWFFLRSDNPFLRSCYAAAFLLEAFILYHTATRGAILGLLGGLAILAAFLAFSSRGIIRRAAIGALVVVALVPALFFLARNADIVRKSEVLARFASISPIETTTQSRFTIWKMALRGWRERPILGWGQESFTYVFSKYYEPSLWRQEPWFDRAHNVFLDWLTAGGIAGLASYLAMYAAALWLLIRSFRKKNMDSATFGIIVSLLAAHFFQNLFVFDNLTSYLLFFAVLAFAHHAAGEPRTAVSRPAFAIPYGVRPAASALAVAAFVLIFYFANLKPIMAAKIILDALKTAQSSQAAGKVEESIAVFRKGLRLNTFGTTELREQVSQTVNPVIADSSLAAQDKAKFAEFAIQEMQKQTSEIPSDIRAKAFLATIYSSVGRSADAIATVNDVLRLSDRRPQFYFIAAEAYLKTNRNEQAVSALRRAYDLAPDYPDAVANLGTVLILNSRESEAEDLMERHFGTRVPAEPRFAQAYAQRGYFKKSAAVWEELVKADPVNAEYYANLGLVYAKTGERDRAISAFEEAIRLEPAFKTRGEELIKQLRSGNPL